MRARQLHGGPVDALLVQAVEQFLPAAAAGIKMAFVVLRITLDMMWILPGIWQIFIALGIVATARSLPRGVKRVVAWYFICAPVVFVFSYSQWVKRSSRPG